MSIQWRNQSSLEAYPFKPGLPRSSGSGEVLDRDFLDFFAVTSGPVWLRSLEISAGGFLGEFESASGEILSFGADDFLGGDLDLVSSLGGVRGSVTLGSDDLFSKLPAGTHLFEPRLIDVVGTLTCPPPPGVTALSPPGSAKAFGVVKLKKGAGVTLELDNGELRIHADGAVKNEDCGPGVAIRSINSVTPSGNGGILFSESSFEVPESDGKARQILRVSPVPNGIKVQLVSSDV